MALAGQMIKIEFRIGKISISEVRTALEMIGIEVNIIKVIGGTLKIETGHMTEVEVGIEIIEKHVIGIEETVDLGLDTDSPLGIKV